MAGTALAAFFLLVTLLQVRADVDCYPDRKCTVGADGHYVASTARECCLDGLPDNTRSYSPVGDSSNCNECIVIGFNIVNQILDERSEQTKTIKVLPLTSGSDDVINSLADITIEVHSSGPNATLGSDLKVNDGEEDTIIISKRLSLLDEDLRLEAINDNDTGEYEHFVFEVSQIRLFHLSSGDELQAFAGDPLTVTITDDDIIEVEFEVTEFQLKEEEENLTVTFKIIKRIPAATHFVVRPMTYKDYDDEYPALLAKYPNIKPFSLQDEYDQAELADFDSTEIHFTIPKDSTEPDRKVVIKVINDDLLEPAEEGFRLVLEVADGTRRTEVKFGRQIALCRIDNTDKIEFGFVRNTLNIVDMLGSFDPELPLHIVSGQTEIRFNLTFSIGDRTNATLRQDYNDFTASKLFITPPESFIPDEFLSVEVRGDDVFEGDELIEVVMEYALDLPRPFQPKHIDDSSGYGSIVDGPSTGSIVVHNRSVLITIEEGVENITAELSLPKVVHEGDTFAPLITVSHKVNVTFRVYNPFSGNTADRDTDFSFEGQNVVFGPTITTNTTSSPVTILTDNLVEPNETFKVVFYVSSPAEVANLMKTSNPNETITIVDQNTATIGFEMLTASVPEKGGPAVLNVMVKGDQLATNAEVVVRFYTSSDTAQSGVDFAEVDKQLTFTGAEQKIAVEIPIINDTMYEDPPETFQAHLQLISSNVTAVVEPTPPTVTIIDDPPIGKVCTLSSSLNLHTFSNQAEPGTDIDLSMGCERKLVTSCDSDVDLEIRVDFFKDSFVSTKLVIYYDEQEVFIDENFNLIPSTPPSNDFIFNSGMMSASVSIPDIKLTITRNRTLLTIFTDDITLQLAGLCGAFNGELVYPDCTDIHVPGDSMDEFIHSFKVKPSDQVLREERKECGITTNDTIISDPLMTVPVHAAGFPYDLNLCYEIHGAADKYFNLVSDECTSVNAHYESAASGSELNIIDSISTVAVGNDGECYNITVDASTCTPVVHKQNESEMTESSILKRRRRSAMSVFDENGVSVYYYESRARISVPNCEDNELVMWVVCQEQSLFDQDKNVTIGPVKMIKFEIARGLNLKETSHGLLGQFWNIPIDVTPYNGSFTYTVDSPEKYYTVVVEHPMSPVRSFVGYMFDVTWEWKRKHCVYAGDRQGGPAGEVARDGSVIQGTYEDYIISDRFETQFKYGVFVEGVCL